LHVIGAGDAKLLMALFGALPSVSFTLLLAAVIVLFGAPRILYARWRARRSGQPVTGLRRPTEEDLLTRGSPDAWQTALAGALYVWWLY
jgi:Flp pilus assembly protein protease CpaA